MDSVEARDGIILRDSVVVTTTKSSDLLRATNSKILGKAVCVSNLTLINSLVGSAEVAFTKENGKTPKITIILRENSKIEGDLIIKERASNQNSNVIEGISVSACGFDFAQGFSQDFDAVSTRSVNLGNVKVNERGQRITVEGPYPFTANARLMIMGNIPSLKINSQGYITSAGGKTVILNGTLLNQGASSSSSAAAKPEECIVEIKGSGTIYGT